MIQQKETMLVHVLWILNRRSLVSKMVLLVSLGAVSLMVMAGLAIWATMSMADLGLQGLDRQGVCVSAEACREALDHGSVHFSNLLAIAALVFALTLSPPFALVTISIVGRARRAQAAARRIAAQDLSHPLVPEGSDEMGLLLQSLAAMQESLVSVVGSVREDADSVALASAEIAQGTQDLSTRTAQQSIALQRTTSALMALTATVAENAANASSASQLAGESDDLASSGGDAVGEVVATMSAIQASSRRMSEVLAVIDGIAFQTNILALNAAVESARAGAAGRGFAVVANEVRELAQRSAESAAEIKLLISSSVAQIDRGASLVGQAGETMQKIIESARNVASLVRGISAASAEQSGSLEQVSLAVASMDEMTQQNAALVEESATASESLRDRGQSLQALVQKFQLNQGRPVNGVHASAQHSGAPGLQEQPRS